MGEMRVLTRKGDERLEWDPKDKKATAAAKAEFDRLKGEGYLFYEVTEARGKPVEKFSAKLDFQDVLRERHAEEVRLVTASTSPDDLNGYWEFRYATLQLVRLRPAARRLADRAVLQRVRRREGRRGPRPPDAVMSVDATHSLFQFRYRRGL